MQYNKFCKQCGNDFICSNLNKLYCSLKCRLLKEKGEKYWIKHSKTDKYKESRRKYYLENKEKIFNIQRKYRIKSGKYKGTRIIKHDLCDIGLCLFCPKINYNKNWKYLRRFYLKNKRFPRVKKSKEEIIKNKIQYDRNRRKKDYIYRIKNNLRRRLRISLISKGTNKNNKTMNYIGCSKEFFIKYIESKFTNEMSWSNYGKNTWHIDHIKPLSLFDLTQEEEIYKAMHYTNLQPLPASENRRKNNKY